MATTTEEVVYGPGVLVTEDGARLTTKTIIRRTDDWVDTEFGPVNFGRAEFVNCGLVPEPVDGAQEAR